MSLRKLSDWWKTYSSSYSGKYCQSSVIFTSAIWKKDKNEWNNSRSFTTLLVLQLFYKYFHNYLAQQNYKDELQPAEKIVHLAVSVTNANGPHWPYIITMTTLYFTLSLLSQWRKKKFLLADAPCIMIFCYNIPATPASTFPIFTT